MVRISKILEGLIAQCAFDATKAGVCHNLKDFLMLSILRSEGSLAHRVLCRKLKDWELYQIALRIEHKIETDRGQSSSIEEFFRNYTNHLKDRFAMQSRTVSTLHALIDILEDLSTHSAHIFARYKITAAVIEEETLDATDDSTDTETEHTEPQKEAQSLLIERFGTDLTRLAAEGTIDPVIGREAETCRVIQILSRRKKNNPVIVGDAGVGKSAIVEGLALKIAAGDVPHAIAGKRIISLDISSLVAGTKFRGEFEERIEQLIEELKSRNDIIVFIDEIHTIIGAGQTQGSLDTANILKPALARGEIQTIGATTFAEYHSSIEKDAALERRFQKIILSATTAEQTLDILQKIAPKYEAFHCVKYTPAALRACVELSERYITERHFPDKAIDLLDEAGSFVALNTSSRPQDLQELEFALSKASMERKEAINQSYYNRAIEARLREIALSHRIKEATTSFHNTLKENPTIVCAEDIARVVTLITGVPMQSVKAVKSVQAEELKATLSSRVIGQPQAIARVTMAIKRSEAGLKDENRPNGVFLFVGPSGVGKTLLAKELATTLMGDKNSLIRLDMSEYSEKHNVSRLIGSPPGYVGYGEGGQLSEAVRHKPYSVVLFDEIEKAHPEVFNTMLQIFDEGILTDGEGRKIDFRNTIIIMTSNAGSQDALQRKVIGYATPSESDRAESLPKSEYNKALERTFRPEFLNRVDEIIFFNSLTDEDAQRIVAMELDNIIRRIKNMGYGVSVTKKAKIALASLCSKTEQGVRALKRILKREIEEPMANIIIDNRLKRHQNIVIDASQNRVVVKTE